MVSTWMKVRQDVLEAVQKREDKSRREPRGKRKLVEDDAASRVPKRQTRSKSRRVTSSAHSAEVVILDSEDEGDAIYVMDVKEPIQDPNGLVACPICNARMKEELVYTHLDRCQGPAPQKKSNRYDISPHQGDILI
jgi:E3 ubiquitin-protein ligase RAD18